MKFYRNSEIEAQAEYRLSQLEAVLKYPLTPPIPIERIAEDMLGLNFLWEPIDELPGEIILGAIDLHERLIVLNENRQTDFRNHPGLERSTKGHEMGHFDLFTDMTKLNAPSLFDDEPNGPVAYRSSPIGEVQVLKALMAFEEGRDLLRQIMSHADDPNEKRAVDRYSSALSMPKSLIYEEALKIDRTQWRNLYRLAEKFEVTISALRVRLEQLGLLYVTKDGKLYESRQQAAGQMTLL